MNNTNFILNKVLRVIVFIVSVIVTFLLVGDPILPKGMGYFALVPFVFGVGYVLSKKTSLYMFRNIGLLMLNITLFIRYIITPFYMWFNGYSIGRGATPSAGNYQMAILLMILEIIVIFITIEIFANRFYKENKKMVPKSKIKVNKNFIGLVFLLITLLVILIYPNLLERYSFILTATEYKGNMELNLPFGSLFPLMVSFSSMLLTITILNKFYKQYELKANSIWIYLSICIVFLMASFIVGTSRFSMLIPMVTGMYLITKLYPTHNKRIYSIFGVLILIAVSISTLVKQFGINLGEVDNDFSNVASSVSSSLQVYFSGVHNVAIAVKAREIFVNDIDFGLIVGDLLSSVMIISNYFTSEFGGVNMFNYAFYNNTISTDQILPMIGQGYLYFGFFFSPIFVIMFTYFMMYFDKKSREGSTVFKVYIYAYISVRFGMFFMSNATILTSVFTNYYLLFLLIFLLNNKFVLFNKKV